MIIPARQFPALSRHQVRAWYGEDYRGIRSEAVILHPRHGVWLVDTDAFAAWARRASRQPATATRKAQPHGWDCVNHRNKRPAAATAG